MNDGLPHNSDDKDDINQSSHSQDDISVPHNTDIEAALLSALLLDNNKCENVSEIITSEHFYARHNARIFEIIMHMFSRGEVVTISTLRHVFESDPLLQQGGLNYLAELATNTNPLLGSSADYYASLIRDFYLKRQLITIGENVIQSAYDLSNLENSAHKQIENAEQQLYSLAESGNSEGGTITLEQAMKQAIEQASKALIRDSHVAGITTGFIALDDMLGGLHPSDLLILAGRPSMGKTALATNIAFNAAKQYQADKENQEGARVLFFSLEMSADQLAMRILAEQSGISSDKLRRGMIKTDDFENISNAAVQMGQIPLYIDDTPALNINRLRQRARRWMRSHGLDLIIIDYLQLLNANSNKRYDNRVAEISEITRGLKTIAKELNIPVLALSQLSREVEKREDNKPMLSDLRESGTIEQDSDVVMFIYRQEYYLTRSTPTKREGESDAKFDERQAEYSKHLEAVKNIAQVIIAKQRHGATGTIDLHFDANLTHFSDFSHREYP